jgi:hypothetical protein
LFERPLSVNRGVARHARDYDLTRVICKTMPASLLRHMPFLGHFMACDAFLNEKIRF